MQDTTDDQIPDEIWIRVFELAGFPTTLGLTCKRFDRLFKASFCFTYSPLCLPPPFPSESGFDEDPFGFKRCIRPTCFMNICLYVEALLSASSLALSNIMLPPPPSVPHLTADNASFQSFMHGMEVFILGYERNVKTLFASKGLIEAACLISIWSGRHEALEELLIGFLGDLDSQELPKKTIHFWRFTINRAVLDGRIEVVELLMRLPFLKNRIWDSMTLISAIGSNSPRMVEMFLECPKLGVEEVQSFGPLFLKRAICNPEIVNLLLTDTRFDFDFDVVHSNPVKLLAFSQAYTKSQGERNPGAVLALLLDDPLNRFSDCCFEALLSFSFGTESAADFYLSLTKIILDHPKVKLSWDQLVHVFESALQAENLKFASCFASHPRLLRAEEEGSPSKTERFHRSKQQLQNKLEHRRGFAIGSETETKGTEEGRKGVNGGEVLEEVEEVVVEEVRIHNAM